MTAGCRRVRARIAMWAAIAFSTVLLLVLLARGWGSNAWSVSAGVLLLSCIGVCVWAGAIGKQTDRSVLEAVSRLADLRRETELNRRGDSARRSGK